MARFPVASPHAPTSKTTLPTPPVAEIQKPTFSQIVVAPVWTVISNIGKFIILGKTTIDQRFNSLKRCLVVTLPSSSVGILDVEALVMSLSIGLTLFFF